MAVEPTALATAPASCVKDQKQDSHRQRRSKRTWQMCASLRLMSGSQCSWGLQKQRSAWEYGFELTFPADIHIPSNLSHGAVPATASAYSGPRPCLPGPQWTHSAMLSSWVLALTQLLRACLREIPGDRAHTLAIYVYDDVIGCLKNVHSHNPHGTPPLGWRHD